MEKSISFPSSSFSSMNRRGLLLSKDQTNSEESGWTRYLEDFFASEEQEEQEEVEDGDISSSVVSDAASYAEWRSSAPLEATRSCKRLSFKKRKSGKGLLDGDPLEDTASSPANSPKVSNLNNKDMMHQTKTDDNKNTSLEKIVGDGERRDEISSELGFVDRTNECTELKRRGLCLVPFSMFIDYL